MEARKGVSQSLNRINTISYLSHLRRINTPIRKDGKVAKPRQIHNSQWMKICPSETPEGQQCGLVKNLSIGADITLQQNTGLFLTRLIHNMNLWDNMAEGNGHQLHLDGVILGSMTLENTQKTVEQLKRHRREGTIPRETSIGWWIQKRTVYIFTDTGRIIRPVIVLGALYNSELGSWDPFPWQTWESFVESSMVDYIDTNEEETLLIAHSWEQIKENPTIRYTHMEIHPSHMLGLAAATIPYPDHNQSPRNTYQCLHYEEPIMMADGTFDLFYCDPATLMNLGTTKSIKDVHPDDYVMSFDTKTMITTPTRVLAQYVKRPLRKLVRVTVESGRSIVVTEDHRFWTIDGWVEAKDLTGIRTSIFTTDTVLFVKITSIKPIQDQSTFVADITVEHKHSTFITGSGFGVHNSAMGKQALGMYATNYQMRWDTVGGILHYPQQAICDTAFSKETQIAKTPAGQNALVAIMCYNGFNQEDSIIMNQSAIDRGLFRSTTYRSYQENDKGTGTEISKYISKFGKNTEDRLQNIDDDGLIQEGTRVSYNDILVCKHASIKDAPVENRKDCSNPTRSDLGIVDKVMLTTDPEGNKLARVRLRSERIPELGDKFCKFLHSEPIKPLTKHLSQV